MQVEVIQLREPGPALGLRPASLMLSPPAPNALTMRHTAIGVNFVDAYRRAGLYPVPAFPTVLGVKGVGVVEAVGTDVYDFAVSQHVAWTGLMDDAPGGYTSYHSIPVERAIALPGSLDSETVAATLMRGITAHVLLTRVRQVSTGDTVLVHAVTGGLGILLMQWTKHQGTHVVGTVDSGAKAAVTIGHSADHIVLYRQQDVRDAVLQLAGGKGVGYVIDDVGNAMLPASLAVTRPLRIVASISQTDDVGNAQTNVVDPTALGPARSIVPTRPGVFRHMADLSNCRTKAQAALQHMLDGVRVPVDSTYALEDATATHTALKAGQASGALLLRP